MKKTLCFVSMLFLFLLSACGEKSLIEPQKFVVKGKVYAGSLSSPVRNAEIIVRHNANPGFFEIPEYRSIGSYRSDSNGEFRFELEETTHISLVTTKSGEFTVDGRSYLKYTESYLQLDGRDPENVLISLSPNGVLSINFRTDRPLEPGETLSVIAGGSASASYSERHPVPNAARFVCRGNKRVNISWTVHRTGEPVLNYREAVFVPAFGAARFTLNY